mmetsp:Transcript_40768/g.76300  ORF Transcript_40768/g.76300 Transcript_40768/m.76300 type:complete len:201 (-) Transcript_40768:528-1130(-)
MREAEQGGGGWGDPADHKHRIGSEHGSRPPARALLCSDALPPLMRSVLHLGPGHHELVPGAGGGVAHVRAVLAAQQQLEASELPQHVREVTPLVFAVGSPSSSFSGAGARGVTVTTEFCSSTRSLSRHLGALSIQTRAAALVRGQIDFAVGMGNRALGEGVVLAVVVDAHLAVRFVGFRETRRDGLIAQFLWRLCRLGRC